MYHFKEIGKDDNNLDLHTYTGFFVGLLLVFRTNISYGELYASGNAALLLSATLGLNVAR
jgi:hypothetical protein